MAQNGAGGVLVFGIIGLGLVLAGIVTDYWIAVDILHQGVWRVCDYNNCEYYVTNDVGSAALWVRVLTAASAGFSLIGVINNIVCLADKKKGTKRRTCRATIAFYIISGFFGAGGALATPLSYVINDVTQSIGWYGYSYWLLVSGSVLLVLVGSCFGCASRKWLEETARPDTGYPVIDGTGHAHNDKDYNPPWNLTDLSTDGYINPSFNRPKTPPPDY